MFSAFAQVSGLSIDHESIKSAVPPEPDIVFTIRGETHYAELVEITDRDLAERWSRSMKTNKIVGGFYSQDRPLTTALESKVRKSYATNGAPLLLLAYYDKQFPADSVDPDLIPRTVGDIAARMVSSGVWQRIWVYDSWKTRVLWVHPSSS